MKFNLKKEIFFKDWMSMHNSEDMPMMAKTCDVGFLAGAMLHEVDYTKNNFDLYTRLFEYEFEFKGNYFFETLSFPAMTLHFQTKIEPKEQEICLQKISKLLNLAFVGDIPRLKTKTDVEHFLLKTGTELEIHHRKCEEGISFSSQDDTIYARIKEDGGFYLEETNNQELLKVIKKIKALRLEAIFT